MTTARFCLVIGLLLTAVLAHAQIKPMAASVLNYHPVRTVDPTDTNFKDLEFLTKEIGDARVVFLGEPTHGEGNVTAAKGRFIQFLQQRMGFTTVAFESGFYEMHQAQRAIDAGKDARHALMQGIFGVWTDTREFQPTLDFLATGKMRVAGFDPQLSGGDYTDDLVDELQRFVGPAYRNESAYDLLEAGISFMGDEFFWSPSVSYPEYAVATRLVTQKLQAIARKEPTRRTEAEFWVQCLAGLLEQGRHYRERDPNAKTAETFRVEDSNSRDVQMAEHLLFYARQHPAEKIICWGASAHFANRPAALADNALQRFTPMGGHFKQHYPGAAYLLATTTAGGYFHPLERSGYDSTAVAAPVAGSIEAQLAARPPAYGFLNLRESFGEAATTSVALGEYKPLTGNWSAVFDGLLFLRAVTPTHAAGGPAAASRPDSTGRARPPRAPVRRAVTGAAGRPGADSRLGALRTLGGTVRDAKTGEAVLFASVQVAGTTVGTVSNAQGTFSLAVPAAAEVMLQVSFVGYRTQQVRVPAGPVQVQLVPEPYALAEVSVTAERLDARTIMKKALKQLPANYVQQDYNMRVYGRSVATNRDTLVQDVEHVSTVYNKNGYRERQYLNAALQVVKWNKQGTTGMAHSMYLDESVGMITNMDVLELNPVFNPKKLKHFNLALGPVERHQGNDVYVVSFVARRHNRAVTGATWVRAYTGKVYVNAADYAVVKCDLVWERDTAIFNANTRRFAKERGNTAARNALRVSKHQIRQVAYYQPQTTGKYALTNTFMEWTEQGTNSLTKQPHDLRSGISLQFYAFRTAPVEVINYENGDYESMLMFKGKSYHEAFWQTFKRPVEGAE